MEDNTQKTVVSIMSHRANSQSRTEIEGAQRCIGMIPWDLQVQQALALCGLHVSDTLLSENVAPSAASHARQVGHETIESLVSKPISEDGLNLNWTEFRAQMFALVYRTKLAIEESNYVEINAMVKEAAEILGHPPVNAAEFHHAKESVLHTTIANLQRESKTRIDDLQDRTKDLMRELNAEKSVVAELRTARQSALEESASRIQQMTRELAVKQDGYEREASNRITEELKKAEASFSKKLSAAQAEMASQIRDAQNERQEAERALIAVTGRIEAGELVEKSRLIELSERLETAKMQEAALGRQMIEINDLLTQAHKRADLLLDEKNALTNTIEHMAVEMAVLEQRMREQVEDKMSSSEFAVLHERLQVRKEEFEAQAVLLSETITQRDEARHSISQLRGRFAQVKQMGSEHHKKMYDQLQAVNGQYAQLNGNFAKLKATNTQLKFVMGGLATMLLTSGIALWMLISHM
jgi:myosin heavy subunit